MKDMQDNQTTGGSGLNWLVLFGVLLIVLAVLAVSTQDRLFRARELMTNSLTSQGELVIRSLESAARASMRHGMGRRIMMQSLVEEMLDHPHVESLTLVGPFGWFVTASKTPKEPKKSVPQNLVANIKKGEPIMMFEQGSLWVGRQFKPLRPLRRDNQPLPEWACPPWQQQDKAPGETDEACPTPGPDKPPLGLDKGENRRGEDPGMMGMGGGRRGGGGGRGGGRGIVEPGDALPYALIQLDTKQFEAAASEDLHQALFLACLIFAAAGAAAAAMVYYAKRKDSELVRLRRQMAQSQHMAAVGRLAASVAHEIRNPLSALRGLVQFITKDHPPDSRQGQYGAVAVEEVDRLERVVSGLLDYARPKEPRRVPLDLLESVESTMALMADDPRCQGVDIQVDAPDKLPEVAADPDQMRQVILNLMVNALEALDGSGRLEFRLRKAKSRFELEIADDGPGLEDANPESLFDPFFSTKERGTGLGLAIARRIARAHGGDLTAGHSDLGGASFVLSLPINGARG